MCHNERLLAILCTEVGEWSYGRHELGEVAPILGMIREIGELEKALAKNDNIMIREAIGRVIIFLAEYLYRSMTPTNDIDWSTLDSSPDDVDLVSREKIVVLGELASLALHNSTTGYFPGKQQFFHRDQAAMLTMLLLILRLTYINRLGLVRQLTYQEATDAILVIASNVWQQVKTQGAK